MKKLYKTLLCVPLIFFSCKWVPSKDYSSILNKTSYRSFESLNEPLLLSFKMSPVFYWNGSKQNEHTIRPYGSIYVIYDWENERVHDFVYSKGYSSSYGSEFLLQTNDGTKTKWYGAESSDYLYSLSADKTKLAEIFDGTYSSSQNWAETNGRPQAVILRTDGDGKSVYAFDSRTEKSNLIASGNYFDYGKAYADGTGNYWMIRRTEKDENKKSFFKLHKIDMSQNKICPSVKSFKQIPDDAVYDTQNGWSEQFNYEIIYADSNHVVLSKTVYKLMPTGTNGFVNQIPCEEKIVSLNLSDMTENETDYPTASSRYYQTISAFKIDGTYYLFSRIQDENKLYSFSYDADAHTLTPLDNFRAELYSAAIRDSRIYFASEKIDSGNPDNHYMILTYFDTVTKRFAEEKILDFDTVTGLAD